VALAYPDKRRERAMYKQVAEGTPES
jgi:hypothetical protein